MVQTPFLLAIPKSTLLSLRAERWVRTIPGFASWFAEAKNRA
jgi:hypothetical protein